VHRPAPVCGQAVELIPHADKILLLLRRKVFPSFHPAKHLMLAIRRQAIKPLQALLVFALCFTRQSPEGGIVLKSFALLIRRLLTLLIEPLAGVVPLRGWLVLGINVRRRNRLPLLRRTRGIAVQVSTGRVKLRTRLTALFPPGLLAIVLSWLLHVRAGDISLLIAVILREQRRYQ
jgi:hypothetical protein